MPNSVCNGNYCVSAAMCEHIYGLVTSSPVHTHPYDASKDGQFDLEPAKPQGVHCLLHGKGVWKDRICFLFRF